METEPGRPASLSREELHQLVWTTPMTHLAKRYGISGNGLAKICNRLGVPFPARGHWAKVAAGSVMTTVPLPAAEPDTPASVRINPTQAPSVRRGERLLEAVPAEVRRVMSGLRVPARLTQPHPIVANWLADREKRRTQARREHSAWARTVMDPGEFTAGDRRRHRFADCLLKNLERCGAIVSQADRGQLVAEIEGSKIEFDLREKLKQVRRPLTQKEREWESWNTSGFRQELQPTGCLLLSIRNYLDGSLRREWLETPQRSMEILLPEVLATIILAAGVIGERRRKAEADAAEYETRRRLQEEERARQRQDDDRWSRFTAAAVKWREMADVRSFMAELKSLPTDSSSLIEGRPIADWIGWAERRLSLGDPLGNGPGAFFNEVMVA